MTCREFADFIMGFMAGELTPGVAASFDRHLSVCPDCRTYLAGYQATVDAGKAAFAADDAQLPGDVPEELIQAILSARRS